jgi:hypothetical protein
MNDFIFATADAGVLHDVRQMQEHLRDNDKHFRGDLTITVTMVSPESGGLRMEVCVDGTDLEVVEADDSAGPITGAARPIFQVDVVESNDQWRIRQYIDTSREC